MKKRTGKSVSRSFSFGGLVSLSTFLLVGALAEQDSSKPESSNSKDPVIDPLTTHVNLNMPGLRSDGTPVGCVIDSSDHGALPKPIPKIEIYKRALQGIWQFCDLDGNQELSEGEFKIILVHIPGSVPFQDDIYSDDDVYSDEHIYAVEVVPRGTRLDTIGDRLNQHAETNKTNAKRIRRNFLYADADANESISLIEFAEYIKFIKDIGTASIAEISSDNEVELDNLQAYKDRIQFYWIRADLDKDEELSRSEFKVLLPITGVYYEPQERERIRYEHNERLAKFAKLNTEFVSISEEIVQPYETPTAFDQRVKKRFKAADADQNGKVSLDEMAKYYATFNRAVDAQESSSRKPTEDQITAVEAH